MPVSAPQADARPCCRSRATTAGPTTAGPTTAGPTTAGPTTAVRPWTEPAGAHTGPRRPGRHRADPDCTTTGRATPRIWQSDASPPGRSDRGEQRTPSDPPTRRPADPPTRRPAENSESAPNRSESTRTHPSSTSSTTFCKRVSTLSVGSDDPVARRRVRDATKPSRRHRKRQREGSCRIRRRRTGQRRKSSNEVLCRRATTARVA